MNAMNLSDPNNSPANNARLLPSGSQLMRAQAPDAWVPAEPIDANPSFSLVEYWEKIRRYKFIIFAFVAVGVAGALTLSFLQTPMYRAHTSLVVEDLNENFQNLKDSDPTAQAAPPESYFQTQVKILQSREMLELVIDKLGLMKRTVPRKHFWSAWLHKNSEPNTPLLREQEVDKLQKNLTVQAWGESQTAEVFYTDPDPKLASEIASTLVQTFIDQSREIRWNSTQNTAEWLTGHLNELKQQLDDSESRLQQYAQSTGIILTSDKQNVTEEKRQSKSSHPR
jgi:succinoglycan biosynthesis transport protein ExoP